MSTPSQREYRDFEPCQHPGCLSHVSYPCEGCGRIAGRQPATPLAPSEAGGREEEHIEALVDRIREGIYGDDRQTMSQADEAIQALNALASLASRSSGGWREQIAARVECEASCASGLPHSECNCIAREMRAYLRGADAPAVTRVEVIDHRSQRGGGAGRAFVALGCAVELSYQDGGRTLKVFVGDAARAAEGSA